MKDSAFYTMLAVCICGIFLGLAGISANHRAAHAERDIDSLRSELLETQQRLWYNEEWTTAQQNNLDTICSRTGIDLYAIDCEAEGNPAD